VDSPLPLFESGCAALSAFDADAMIELCTDDVEFSSAITAVDSTRYRGADGIREYIANLSETFEWLDVRPTALTGTGDRWITTNRFRARGRGSGVEIEQIFYQAMQLSGERARWWSFHETVDAARLALGLDEAVPQGRGPSRD
jgi:ketosteroid isomerase-like protein